MPRHLISPGILGWRDESGAAYLIIAVFAVLILFIAGALGVDLVTKYRLEQMAQDVADHAAMAGAARLPDTSMARDAATKIIQGYATQFYVPDTEHIQVSVSADNTAGTVGVIIYGAWDAAFMPKWITGDPTYGISRYAIATMAMTWTRDTMAGDFENAPGGPVALFIGDPTCAASVVGNNDVIYGTAHTNSCITVGDGVNDPTLVGGQFKYDQTLAACITLNLAAAGGGSSASTYQEMPEPDEANLATDVSIDEDNAAWTSYYDATLYPGGFDGPELVIADDDGAPGNGSAGEIEHPNIKLKWMGAGADPEWKVVMDNANITGATVGGVDFGNALDLYIDGSASVSFPSGSGCAGEQCYFMGSVRSTEKLTTSRSNSEIRAITETGTVDEDGDAFPAAVPGKDNADLAIYAGTEVSSCNIGFSNGGNTVNIYGLVFVPGRTTWTGNMNVSNAPPAPGDPGEYDLSNAVPSIAGFIKGALYTGSVSSTGNNFKIYGDQSLVDDPPILNAVTPLRPSSPTVALKR